MMNLNEQIQFLVNQNELFTFIYFVQYYNDQTIYATFQMLTLVLNQSSTHKQLVRINFCICQKMEDVENVPSLLILMPNPFYTILPNLIKHNEIKLENLISSNAFILTRRHFT